MRILKAERSDIMEVAKLHLDAFPGFFLTSLGVPFLEELYTGFLSHPSGIFIVAKDERGIIGFAAGTSAPDSFFSDLRRRRCLAFASKAIPSILRNPLPVMKKLLLAMRYRGGVSSESPPKGALLSSIGIAIACRGDGTAARLLQEFERAVKDRGVDLVYLTTDAQQNGRVNAFYKKQGYVVVDHFQQSGKRSMFRYEKQLNRITK